MFARGDRRLSQVLERAVEFGCRFDGWREHFDFAKWLQAFADCGIDPNWYLRQRGEEEILPWEHIDCGLPKSFFRSELEKALAGAATLDCRDGVCYGCGVCDFEQRQMKLTALEEPVAPVETAAMTAEPEELTRVRLKLTKRGRARMVAHLEYLSMFQRAVRRAGLPIRFSGGFHPKPKISYLEALPMGVASEAELVDLELLHPLDVDRLIADINVQLPDGFTVIEGKVVHWKSPSPSAAVAASCYRVPLPQNAPTDLNERIANMLAADQLIVHKQKKGRQVELDLRPDIESITQIDVELKLPLVKGSPLQVAAYLLEMDVEEIRRLQVRKIGIILKNSAADAASGDAPASH